MKRASANADSRAPTPQGIVATVGGREVAVGNSRLLAARGVRLKPGQSAEEALWQAKGALVPPSAVQPSHSQCLTPGHVDSKDWTVDSSSHGSVRAPLQQLGLHAAMVR